MFLFLLLLLLLMSWQFNSASMQDLAAVCLLVPCWRVRDVAGGASVIIIIIIIIRLLTCFPDSGTTVEVFLREIQARAEFIDSGEGGFAALQGHCCVFGCRAWAPPCREGVASFGGEWRRGCV